MAKTPMIYTRVPPEMRTQIEARLAHRRQQTGANTTISEWLREAAAEKLAREGSESAASPPSTFGET